jgi:hypothetical protein
MTSKKENLRPSSDLTHVANFEFTDRLEKRSNQTSRILVSNQDVKEVKNRFRPSSGKLTRETPKST